MRSSVPFYNSGSFTLSSSRLLTLAGGGPQSSTFANNGVLAFAGNHSLNSGSGFTGPGTIQFGSSLADSDVHLNTPITISQPFEWQGGRISGKYTLSPTGSVYLSGWAGYMNLATTLLISNTVEYASNYSNPLVIEQNGRDPGAQSG